jgi:hypothetical protein
MMNLPRWLLGLLAKFWPSVSLGGSFKLGLALRATEEIVNALVLNDDMRLTAVNAFTTDRISEHCSFLLRRI